MKKSRHESGSRVTGQACQSQFELPLKELIVVVYCRLHHVVCAWLFSGLKDVVRDEMINVCATDSGGSTDTPLGE